MSGELNDGFEDIVTINESGEIEYFFPLYEPRQKRARKNCDFSEASCPFAVLLLRQRIILRFRMPRRLFQRIQRLMRGMGKFKDGLTDAVRKPGIKPKIKLIAVLLVLSYVMSFDAVDELCEVADSTTRISFPSFLTFSTRSLGRSIYMFRTRRT